MLLRGARAHLLTSCATLLLAFVVAVGAVGVVGASRVGHTPAAVAAMLALYGGVALAEQSARSAADRGHDVALARLRGMTGARLVGFAAGPLLVVSLLGVAAGAAAGTVLAGRIAHGWHASYSLATPEVVVGVALVLGAWVTIAVVAAAVIRRPLADALSAHPRRRTGSWVTSFLEILIVAAAVLAVYEAHRAGPGWVPLVAPALVALAAGQVVAWLLLLTPRVGRRLGVALTSRRLRRDPDPGSVVRLLVAAAVLLAVTLTGLGAAAAWRDDSAHLRAGGPVIVPFPGALRAYAASHDADPRGRWLMAAVSVDDLRPDHRRVFVDAERWPAVVGDFFASTSVSDATSHMSALAAQPDPVMFRGATVRVRVAGLARTPRGTVVLSYLSDAGFPQGARVPVTHAGSATAPLRQCRVGCSLLSVTVHGPAAFVVRRVSAASTDLVTRPVVHHAHRTTTVVSLDDGVRQPGLQPALQVLATPGVRVGTTIDGIDGTSPSVTVVGSVGAVPFLGRDGTILDLSRVLRGAVGTVAAARSVVVARADTPPAVLATLRHDGGGRPTSYASAQRALASTPQARADRLGLVIAVGVAFIALTHLGAWLAGQTGRRRAEVAGLRAAGVVPPVVRRAYVVEALVLASVVLVAAAAVAAATTTALLRPMDLVGGWSAAPVLDLAPRPWTLAGVVLGVALVTAGSCVVVFTRFGRAARPAALRGADQ